MTFAKHSGPLRVNGTTFIELAKAYVLLNSFVGEGNESVEAFRKIVTELGVLEALKTALSKPEVAFRKPNLCKKDIEPIGRVEVAALTNARFPRVWAATALALAEDFVRRSKKTVNSRGLDRGERYSIEDEAGNIINWRVLHIEHEFGSLVAFFEDRDALDYVPPAEDPVDDCGFTEECDDDDDDECEPLNNYCMSRFRPAC